MGLQLSYFVDNLLVSDVVVQDLSSSCSVLSWSKEVVGVMALALTDLQLDVCQPCLLNAVSGSARISMGSVASQIESWESTQQVFETRGRCSGVVCRPIHNDSAASTRDLNVDDG